ncbi:MAG: DUF3488 domain-containing transglutaminase family protein [Burkholderiales bacterium]|nr:DUF3488 domain-containing transglutaminase family protein [Burkholderiales bacterium]
MNAAPNSTGKRAIATWMTRGRARPTRTVPVPMAEQPDVRARRWLTFALLLAQLAHVGTLDTRITVVGGAALLLATCLRAPPRAFLWRAMLLVATVGAGVLVFATHGKLFSRDAGMALLFLFGPLKLMEARTTRDFMVVWALGLMLYVTSFFDNLGLLAALSVPVVIIVYITAMRLFEARADDRTLDVRSNTLLAHLRGAAAHIVLGIPLAAMLFILFPRATAPLWGMRDVAAARTGLSEEMRPGQIAQLIKSTETAFRVEFDGRRPPQSALYWRGPVLRDFDGVAWSIGPAAMQAAVVASSGNGPDANEGKFIDITPEAVARDGVAYSVTLERQDTRWLPLLELPLAYPTGPAIDNNVFLTDAQQIGLKRVGTAAMQFRAKSLLRAQYAAAPPDGQSPELRTGRASVNPRARALAAELAAQYPAPEARIRALVTRFNREPFFYTLNPPLYGGERGGTAIDEFLFDGKRGFCEHFAGATAFVLRAGGIPARVVTGYLGGEYHPAGYMIVRQSDAHAWVETWVDGHWWRLDPTAAVAPDRVERGLQDALPETERLLVSGRGWLGSMALANLWDAASFSYTKWVIGFDRDRQKELLNELGLSGLNAFAALGWMLLAITGSGALMGAAWWLWQRRQEATADDSLREWRRLRRRLNAAGLVVASHETVSAATQRAAQRWPTLANEFTHFARHYNQRRFAPASAQAETTAPRLSKLPFAWQLRRRQS